LNLACGSTNHYFDPNLNTDKQQWEELYPRIISENSEWMEERAATEGETETPKEDTFQFLEEKEETMWRCPQDKILTDLTMDCGFCGLGIADYE
jgi:hypothetical protein